MGPAHWCLITSIYRGCTVGSIPSIPAVRGALSSFCRRGAASSGGHKYRGGCVRALLHCAPPTRRHPRLQHAELTHTSAQRKRERERERKKEKKQGEGIQLHRIFFYFPRTKEKSLDVWSWWGFSVSCSCSSTPRVSCTLSGLILFDSVAVYMCCKFQKL